MVLFSAPETRCDRAARHPRGAARNQPGGADTPLRSACQTNGPPEGAAAICRRQVQPQCHHHRGLYKQFILCCYSSFSRPCVTHPDYQEIISPHSLTSFPSENTCIPYTHCICHLVSRCLNSVLWSPASSHVKLSTLIRTEHVHNLYKRRSRM